MKISRFIFNMFGENCYVAYDEASRQAMIIDPGMIDRAECDAITEFIDRNHLTVTHLVNTHMHLDHIFGDNFIKNRYGVKIECGKADANMGENLAQMVSRFGIRTKIEPVVADVFLKPGDEILIGDEKVKVIAVPGHSPGSIALYAPESGVVFTGDALFAGSIGRTDLEGGDHNQLVNSIRRNLLTLPDDTIVLPGHGGETTIAREKAANPFL